MALKYRFIFLLLIFGGLLLSAQKIDFSGKIQGKNKALESVSLLFLAEDNSLAPISIQTNAAGEFKVKLKANNFYELWISHFGYISQTIEIKTDEKTIEKTFILEEETQEVSEVIYKSPPPIVIKKDTTTFRISAFATGTESRLQDVAKKIPGLEIDKNGNTKYLGQRVGKLKIEDNDFFGSGTSLGMKNIPANAVSNIQIIENHSETSFMKKYVKNNDIVLNVQLKKDKKDITFGDLESSVNISKNYRAHSTVFRVSPKWNFYGIGDFNNVNSPALSLQNYRDFSGDNFLSKESNFQNDSKFSFFNFIQRKKVEKASDAFLAIHTTRELNSKLSLRAFHIFNRQKTEQKSLVNNFYLTSNLEESIEDKKTMDTQIQIGELKWIYKPIKNQKLSSVFNYKFSQNKLLKETYSSNIPTIQSPNKEQPFSLSFRNKWQQKISQKHNLEAALSASYDKNKSEQQWLSTSIFLGDFINWANTDTFQIQQFGNSSDFRLESFLHNYWSLGRYQQLIWKLSYAYFQQENQTRNFQKTETDFLNLDSQGFGFHSSLNQHFISNELNHKFWWKNMEFKYGLTSLYHLQNASFNSSKNKLYLSPNFLFEYYSKNKTKVKLSYDLKYKFPSILELIEGKSILSRNSISQGNGALKPQIYHELKGSFRDKISSKIRHSIYLNARVYQRSISSNSQNIGLNQWIQKQNLDFKENYTIGYSILNFLSKSPYSFNYNYRLQKYEQFSNNQPIYQQVKSHSISASISSKFKSFPNIRSKISYLFSQNSNSFSSDFKSSNLLFNNELSHDFPNGIVCIIDYNINLYHNKNSNLRDAFHQLDFYGKYPIKKTNFEITLRLNNLLADKNQTNIYRSDFLRSETTNFNLGRTYLASILYRF